jgi:hypothetical protein
MGWETGFQFPAGAILVSFFFFVFTTASRRALGPTQPPIQWVPGALSSGTKRTGREADHSPPSSAEVKNTLSYTPTTTPQYAFMVWDFVKQRDDFTFTFNKGKFAPAL